ncbi:MAG: hypothetical protein ABFD52_08935 [Acidobacteriota bacterium]
MSPMLPFSDVIISRDADPELRPLADRHYSRKTPGAPKFSGPGKIIVLRNPEGTWLFVWRNAKYRLDGQEGWECSIFRNESVELSSKIILRCEGFVTGRKFTYVDAKKIRSTNPGCCFLQAGWERAGKSRDRGLVLLVKDSE